MNNSTVVNVLDEMGIDFSYDKRSDVGELISKRYVELGNSLLPKINQKEYKATIKVRHYPVDFIPEMKRIITQYIEDKTKLKPYPVDDAPVHVIKEKEVKVKRKRIKR